MKEKEKTDPKIDRPIIKGARVTEKATFLSGRGAYVFNVSSGATASEVKKAVSALYKVRPVKVNMLPVPRKASLWRGRRGFRSGGRKAVVYLKKGEKIELS